MERAWTIDTHHKTFHMEPTKNSSSKSNRIIYWIATIWLSLGMVSSGIIQLLKTKEEIALMESLAYPVYLLTILGTWKMLGVITILAPGFRLLKEWAYAGFFFLASGAVISHLFSGHSMKELFGPLLLVVLTITSWYFRPANRKLLTN
jgi:uncharacterized membrane protein YhaH (DUF805 family)